MLVCALGWEQGRLIAATGQKLRTEYGQGISMPDVGMVATQHSSLFAEWSRVATECTICLDETTPFVCLSGNTHGLPIEDGALGLGHNYVAKLCMRPALPPSRSTKGAKPFLAGNLPNRKDPNCTTGLGRPVTGKHRDMFRMVAGFVVRSFFSSTKRSPVSTASPQAIPRPRTLSAFSVSMLQ